MRIATTKYLFMACANALRGAGVAVELVGQSDFPSALLRILDLSHFLRRTAKALRRKML
jgi:hypothetical protein